MSDADDANDTLDYDPETGVYRIEYDATAERPSLVILSAVASITGRDVTELPLLQDTIAPESLDDLFGPTAQGRARGDGRVEFTYEDFQVSVYSDGLVELQPIDGGAVDAGQHQDDAE